MEIAVANLTPKELLSKLIGDYSYARAGFRVEVNKRIESPMSLVHPQGGAGRYVNDQPHTFETGTIHMQASEGYINHNPVATLTMKDGLVTSVNVYMRDGNVGEKLIRYLGKRLAVVEA